MTQLSSENHKKELIKKQNTTTVDLIESQYLKI